MRLGRIILAGLAPLVGISALAARPAAFIPPESRQISPAYALPLLFQAVVPLLISAADSDSRASLHTSSANCGLTLPVLWLLASVVAVDLLFRRHTRTRLRC